MGGGGKLCKFAPPPGMLRVKVQDQYTVQYTKKLYIYNSSYFAASKKRFNDDKVIT